VTESAPRRLGLAATFGLATIVSIALAIWSSAALARSVPAADRLWNRGFVATSITGDHSPFERPGQIEIYFYAHGFFPDSIQWHSPCRGADVPAQIGRHRVWAGRPEDSGHADCPRQSERKVRWLVRFFRAGPRWHLADGRLTLTTGRWEMRLAPKDVLYRG
jgi:hypothetical protein